MSVIFYPRHLPHMQYRAAGACQKDRTALRPFIGLQPVARFCAAAAPLVTLPTRSVCQKERHTTSPQLSQPSPATSSDTKRAAAGRGVALHKNPRGVAANRAAGALPPLFLLHFLLH